MANVNAPHGFAPVRSLDGSGHAHVTYMNLAAANSAIGRGDPVTITGGYVDAAAASAALCGIAAEPKGASSSDTFIAVWADPAQFFEAQTDDGTGVLTAVTGIGLNADFIASAALSAAGLSTAEVDESSGNTTATLPFKVISLQKDPKNAYGEFNRLVVKINNHQMQGHTGTAGS